MLDPHPIPESCSGVRCEPLLAFAGDFGGLLPCGPTSNVCPAKTAHTPRTNIATRQGPLFFILVKADKGLVVTPQKMVLAFSPNQMR